MKKRRPDFNVYQQAVLRWRRGRAVCMASPGSGKTAVVVDLVRQLLAEGVPIQEILCNTFTREGANEMAERAGIDTEHKLFCTFHSWALAFVKKEFANFPFALRKNHDGDPMPLALPQEASRHLGLAVRHSNTTYRPEFKIEYDDAKEFISLMKRRGIGPNKAMLDANGQERGEMLAHIYQSYDASMRKAGVMDFDSLIIEAARLLSSNPEVKARWQYRFVIVDEAQDTDAVQWRIVSLISEGHGTVLAVGDENQAMYGWRGSEGNLVGYFQSIFPDAVVYPLPINYRSTGAIVAYCKKIAPVKNETVEKFHTLNEWGAEPEYKLYANEDKEADGVLNSITDFENSAILARTNGQLAIYETMCSERNYRYKNLGKSGFWGAHEVKDVLAIVGSVVFPTDGAVSRMLTSHCEATKYLRRQDTFKDGKRYKGIAAMLKDFQAGLPFDSETGKPVLLHKLMSRFSSGEAQDDQLHHIGHMMHECRQRVKNMAAGDAVELLLERWGVREQYEDDEKDAGFDNDPLENIDKIVLQARKHPTAHAFYEHVQKIFRARRCSTGFITLATIHAAKGKEWNQVFVVGVNDEILPHKNGDPLEELKIYHVGCSRAAKRLTVSCNGVPSILIKDLVKPEEDKWAGFELTAPV